MTAFENVRNRLLLAESQSIFLTDNEKNQLESEINNVLAIIANADNFENAENFLKELGEMQEILATICFKYKIELSSKLRALVRVYDRWDENTVRKSVFDAIRMGTFLGTG